MGFMWRARHAGVAGSTTMLLWLVCACGSTAGGTNVFEAPTDATATVESLDAQFDSVSVYGHVTFGQDRHVISAVTLLMGDQRGAGGLAPPGFDTDGWPPPQSFDAEAGKEMAFFAKVFPDCTDATPGPLALIVRSGPADDTAVDDRLPLFYLGLADVVRKFCSGSGIHLASGGKSTANPLTGTASVDTVLVNSGSEAVTVVSREWTTPAGVHWHPASVTIPPGGRRTLTIDADGPVCTSRYPDQLGLIETEDGVAVTPPYNDVNTLC
jgi:hypothetical protein